MKKFVLGVAAVAALTLSGYSAQAQTEYSEMPAGVYVLDKTHAQIVWQVSHMGLSNYTARFTKFDAELTFDPAAPEKSTLSVSVDPTSVKTDYPYPEKKDFDATLASSEQWFNAGEFAHITFVSKDITRNANNTGTLVGDLTFLGVTKPLSLDVQFNGAMAEHPFSKKAAIGFSATGVLKRSDWGLNTHLPNIGDEVKLIIEAEFQKGE